MLEGIESYLTLEFWMPNSQVFETGSVRVDFLGGTLDIHPINLVLPNVVTLNAALTLAAEVKISQKSCDGVEIFSHDYNETKIFKTTEFSFENIYSNNHFKHYTLVAQVLKAFDAFTNLHIELKSGSPPGAGLGGSSAMAITLATALNKFTQKGLSKEAIFKLVFNIEARVLDSGPTGYQDYYPALMGGFLALKMEQESLVVEQLYTPELINVISENIILVYSGITRLSAINNWEVFKGFFNKEERMRKGLAQIAELSHRAYTKIKQREYKEFLELIKAEGDVRKSLFPTILAEEIVTLFNQVKKIDDKCGIKACGAGGGGCFILISTNKFNNKRGELEALIAQNGMKLLNFSIAVPKWI